MARYFLDSSALVKRYHMESGSSAVAALVAEPGNQFFISRLALVELHSCFARLVREALLTNADFQSLTAVLEKDVAAGVVAVTAISSQRLAAASAVISTFGLTNAVRTLDAIHLASAQALHGRSRLAAFVAADKRLLTVASACGLPTLDVS
jgi:uncharacterized protein